MKMMNTGSNPLIDTGIENPISLEQIKKAILRAKLEKSSGCDDLLTEVLTNDIAPLFMFKLFHTCYESGVIPSLWRKGVINPIHKDNTLDRRDPTNYQGITLACSMYKQYCSVLNSRLVEWAEANKLNHDSQNGFRSDCSCVDQISSLTNIIETRKQMKKTTMALFVDFSKAFDRISRQFLCNKLNNMGLSRKMLTALQCIYTDVQWCVQVNGIKKTHYFQSMCHLP